MGLTRKTSARPFETVKVRAQSGTLAARPTAGRGILGYICWAEDVETLYSCQLVAGVPTWVTVGPPTFDQVNAALALADQPIDINGVQLTSVLGIQMDQSTADVVGEIGMNAAGRILLDVSGTANSPVALLSDLAPVQPVQGLKPIADAAAIDETPNTSFFVNTSGAPMTVTASEIVANGTLTLAAGNANINLIKTLAAGGSSTIATLTPAASPGGDWAAGATVPFPAFSAVTLAAGDKLGYSITKNNLPAGVVVPSLLVAATTSYLSPLRAQGMKPIPDAAATDTVGNTRFYVNTTGAAVTVSSASLISNGARRVLHHPDRPLFPHRHHVLTPVRQSQTWRSPGGAVPW